MKGNTIAREKGTVYKIVLAWIFIRHGRPRDHESFRIMDVSSEILQRDKKEALEDDRYRLQIRQAVDGHIGG